jgi:hypothetical protein
MYIVLHSSHGNGAGRAYGPFETKAAAQALVDEVSAEYDSEDDNWNDSIWLDVLKVHEPVELTSESSTLSLFED